MRSNPPRPRVMSEEHPRAVERGATPLRVSPLVRTPLRLQVVFLLLLVASVAWRKGTYYSGGLDAVVVAKGVLTLVALATVVTAPRQGLPWSRLRAAPLVWLLLYLAISAVGGLLGTSGLASVVLAARLGLLAVTLVLIMRRYPWQTVLSSLMSSMLVLALVSGATGIASISATGRLYGGILPLNANEISLLISVPVICIVWRIVNGLAGMPEVLTIVPLLGVIWLTGARTGLAAVFVAVCLLVMMAPRIPVPLFSLSVLAIPLVLYLAFWTPLLTGFASRGGSESVTTLNSRTVAWSAALRYADTDGAKLFGSGLAVKEIPVSAMYRSEQIFDSTWVSALVQSGLLGTAVLVMFVVASLAVAVTLQPPERSLVVAILLMLTLISVLESGLFDSTPSFIAFFVLVSYAHSLPGQTSRE